jgi:hypothetical protein
MMQEQAFASCLQPQRWTRREVARCMRSFEALVPVPYHSNDTSVLRSNCNSGRLVCDKRAIGTQLGRMGKWIRVGERYTLRVVERAWVRRA